MTRYKARIVGVAPLLMHNVRMVDKQNQFTRALAEINAKRKKTDEDEAERARLEWYGGMYANEQSRPILPADLLWACIADGAKITRDGKTAAAGLLEVSDAILEYDGPRTLDALWANGGFADRRVAVVQRQRIMRVRPCFASWAATFEILADTETTIKNSASLKQWIEDAGRYKGIGDYRPRFGRFNLESFEEVAL